MNCLQGEKEHVYQVWIQINVIFCFKGKLIIQKSSQELSPFFMKQLWFPRFSEEEPRNLLHVSLQGELQRQFIAYSSVPLSMPHTPGRIFLHVENNPEQTCLKSPQRVLLRGKCPQDCTVQLPSQKALASTVNTCSFLADEIMYSCRAAQVERSFCSEYKKS